MLRGLFLLIILIFLILSMLPLFQLATNKHERRDLQIGASYKGDVTVVNIFDYNKVVSDLNKQDTGIESDLTRDGKVDIDDYNLVVERFSKKK